MLARNIKRKRIVRTNKVIVKVYDNDKYCEVSINAYRSFILNDKCTAKA